MKVFVAKTVSYKLNYYNKNFRQIHCIVLFSGKYFSKRTYHLLLCLIRLYNKTFKYMKA